LLQVGAFLGRSGRRGLRVDRLFYDNAFYSGRPLRAGVTGSCGVPAKRNRAGQPR
jgi:hypothetical protein